MEEQVGGLELVHGFVSEAKGVMAMGGGCQAASSSIGVGLHIASQRWNDRNKKPTDLCM